MKNTIIFFLMILLSLIVPSNFSFATEQLIRVGVVPDEHLYTFSEQGELSGYDYYYLMEIAQHTGWEYEFVFIEDENVNDALLTSLAMLEAGEIDLLGSVNYDDTLAERIEYGTQHYGMARYTFTTLGSNDKITPDNYFLYKHIRVALVDEAFEEQSAFQRLVEMNNMEPEITYAKNHSEALQLLMDDEVDAIMFKDIAASNGLLVTLATMSPKPFYFATTKGNTQLIEELDQAILAIQQIEPTISQRLKNEFHDDEHKEILILTAEEKEALSHHEYLTFGLMKGVEPYQFFQNSQIPTQVPRGISTEILEIISTIIDVEFRYIWVDSLEEMLEKLETQEIDFFATLPRDYAIGQALNVTLTRPYISSNAVWLQHIETPIATNIYAHYVSGTIGHYPRDEITLTSDIITVLKSLESGAPMELFCDPYIAQYYLQREGFTKIQTRNISTTQSEICLGAGKHIDLEIIGLLNHAILHLNEPDVDEITFHNVTNIEGVSLMAFVRSNSVTVITTICMIFFLIFGGMLLYTLYIQKMRKLLSTERDKMELLAKQDSMTQLYNSGSFHQLAEDNCRTSSTGCLILFDIDYFKQVNDTHGHQKGDLVIKEVAKAISCHFSHGIVGRLGGDEFVVLLTKEHSIPHLEQLSSLVLKDLENSPAGIPITLSIGGYVFQHVTPYETLYQLADQSLYVVKERGRNGFHFQHE